MPKLTRKPPAYSHHKPSGQARVRYQGRDHYLGPYGSRESREAYSRLIAEFSRDSPVPVAPTGGPTVAEVILAFWSHAQVYYRHPDGTPTGEHLVIRCALKPLRRLYGTTPAAEFKAKQLRLLRDEMIRLGWSRRYINDQVGRVKRTFTWAASEELVPESVPASLATVKGLESGRSLAREKPPVEAVPDDVVEATLPYLPPIVADIVRLLRLRGARVGEFLAITPDRLDRSDPECWSYSPIRHKTSHRGKTRIIYFGPRAIALLTSYLDASEGGRLFGYTPNGVLQAIERACDRAFPHPELSAIARDRLAPEQEAELKAWRKEHRWHPHRLRHATATEVRGRFGIDAAQAVLGNSELGTTETYAAVDTEKGREAMRQVG